MISESFSVQFRAEFFNILNHPNFGPPLPFFNSGHAQIFKLNGGGGDCSYLVTQPRDIQFAGDAARSQRQLRTEDYRQRSDAIYRLR
jgi:hypothetical protein